MRAITCHLLLLRTGVHIDIETKERKASLWVRTVIMRSLSDFKNTAGRISRHDLSSVVAIKVLFQITFRHFQTSFSIQLCSLKLSP